MPMLHAGATLGPLVRQLLAPVKGSRRRTCARRCALDPTSTRVPISWLLNSPEAAPCHLLRPLHTLAAAALTEAVLALLKRLPTNYPLPSARPLNSAAMPFLPRPQSLARLPLPPPSSPRTWPAQPRLLRPSGHHHPLPRPPLKLHGPFPPPPSPSNGRSTSPKGAPTVAAATLLPDLPHPLELALRTRGEPPSLFPTSMAQPHRRLAGNGTTVRTGEPNGTSVSSSILQGLK